MKFVVEFNWSVSTWHNFQTMPELTGSEGLLSCLFQRDFKSKYSGNFVIKYSNKDVELNGLLYLNCDA